jgi:peptidoglycan/LPS O-acetylase OafA/YrhL
MASSPTVTLAAKTVSFTQPPAGTSFYRPELDVVRFFAFLSVFVYHTLDTPLDHLVEHHVPMWFVQVQVSISRAGAYGVDLFFVLSAYLITELLIREKETRGSLNVKSFYLRRILRIWPLYYFFIPLAALVPFLNPEHAFTLRYFVGFLFLVGNWSTIAFGPPYSAALPLWSVSVEEQFYLLWPPVVARLSRRQIAFTAVGMIVIANATRVVVLLLHGNGWSVWANTLARLDPMAAGILLAIFLHGGAPNIRLGRRLLMISGGVAGIALTEHFAAPWGSGLPGLGHWAVIRSWRCQQLQSC